MAAKLLYDQDFVDWTQDAARALREGRPDKAGIDLVAMEIEDMGKRDRRSVENNLRVLLYHLLKWHFQPAKRSSCWKRSIVEHRGRLELVLRDCRGRKNRAIYGSTKSTLREPIQPYRDRPRIFPRALPMGTR